MSTSDAQRAAQDAASRAAWIAHKTAWLNSLDLTRGDLHALPRKELLVDLVPGSNSLRDAIAAADVIIEGRVLTIAPSPGDVTTITMAVSYTIKGPSSATISFAQDGGLEPKSDWSGPEFLLQIPGQQLLLPGDSAILFLQAWSGGYYIQPVTGFYLVSNGALLPDTLNTWAGSLKGSADSVFLAQIRSAM